MRCRTDTAVGVIVNSYILIVDDIVGLVHRHRCGGHAVLDSIFLVLLPDLAVLLIIILLGNIPADRSSGAELETVRV